MQLSLFSELVKSYKVIFFDSYGVLRNHRGLIPGAEACVARLRASDMHLRVLTNNAARSPQMASERLAYYGLNGIAPEEIITSGATTRQFLQQKIKSGQVAYLGTEKSATYIISAGLEAIPVSKVDLANLEDIKAVAFLDDEGYDLNTDITKVINLLRYTRIPVVVANTDLLYPVAKNDVAIATGSIARLAEYVLGRRFVKFGKPAIQMFQLAFNAVQQEDPSITHSDILMVGDTLHTDILGGNTFGIDTALVLSGNTRAANAETEIRASGIIPDFVCRSIGH